MSLVAYSPGSAHTFARWVLCEVAELFGRETHWQYWRQSLMSMERARSQTFPTCIILQSTQIVYASFTVNMRHLDGSVHNMSKAFPFESSIKWNTFSFLSPKKVAYVRQPWQTAAYVRNVWPCPLGSGGRGRRLAPRLFFPRFTWAKKNRCIWRFFFLQHAHLFFSFALSKSTMLIFV